MPTSRYRFANNNSWIRHRKDDLGKFRDVGMSPCDPYDPNTKSADPQPTAPVIQEHPLYDGCQTSCEDVIRHCLANFVDRQGMSKTAVSEDLFKIKASI